MRRKLTIAGAILLLLVGQSSFVSPASAAEFLDNPVSPPAERVHIDIVTVNGSGCPAGTASVQVAPDNTEFTVTYSQYVALVGVGASPVDFRKNCQLNLAIHVPRGYTYAVVRTDFRGFASLAPGATAMQRANYYFQGQPQSEYRTHTFTGPLEDNWQTTDEINTSDLVFHPCGALRNLNINTELRVSAGTSDPATTTSFLTMDSTRGAVSTYRLQWNHCS